MKFTLKLKVISVLFLAFGIFYICTKIFFQNLESNLCSPYYDVAENKDILNEIWVEISKYYDDPLILKGINQRNGLVYLYDLEEVKNTNWEIIKFSNDVIGVEWYGKNINYKSIKPSDVEEILVGGGKYGRFGNLVFIPQKHKSVIDHEKNGYKVKVSCR